MVADFILNLMPQDYTLTFLFFVASAAFIIFAVRTIPYRVVKKVSAGINVNQFSVEKALGVISIFPEAVIIFVLVNSWFHITALYTVIGLNIATILVGLIMLMVVGKQNFFPHIYKPQVFIILIALIVPFMLLYEYGHIDPRTAFVLILSYITYVLFTRIAMNEPAHPVEYSVEIKPLKRSARKTLIPLTLMTASSIALLFLGTEMFIITSKILIVYYEVPKIYLSIILGALLVLPKIKSFNRLIKAHKGVTELYTHEVFYNIASGTALNSILIYTISFTFALITLN